MIFVYAICSSSAISRRAGGARKQRWQICAEGRSEGLARGSAVVSSIRAIAANNSAATDRQDPLTLM